MKKSRYTDSQIISIMKQAEAGTPVPELCREHGMSSASFYKWRAKYPWQLKVFYFQRPFKRGYYHI
jgi:transposase-like protein